MSDRKYGKQVTSEIVTYDCDTPDYEQFLKRIARDKAIDECMAVVDGEITRHQKAAEGMIHTDSNFGAVMASCAAAGVIKLRLRALRSRAE